MTSAPLWRGYWFLFASTSAAAFIMQIDLAMVARLGGRASGAYAILMRITLLDVAVTIACAAVAAIALGHAQKNGETADAIEKTCALSLVLGVATAIFGFFAYPIFLDALMGDAAAAPYIGAPIVWLVAGAPFRVLSNTQGFLLHALGRGGSVLTWKLAEIPVKAGRQRPLHADPRIWFRRLFSRGLHRCCGLVHFGCGLGCTRMARAEFAFPKSHLRAPF